MMLCVAWQSAIRGTPMVSICDTGLPTKFELDSVAKRIFEFKEPAAASNLLVST